jgi:hypothetical protein
LSWTAAVGMVFRRMIYVVKRFPRLLDRGKAKKLALTALMRKLIVLANHLLKNPDFILAV